MITTAETAVRDKEKLQSTVREMELLIQQCKLEEQRKLQTLDIEQKAELKRVTEEYREKVVKDGKVFREKLDAVASARTALGRKLQEREEEAARLAAALRKSEVAREARAKKLEEIRGELKQEQVARAAAEGQAGSLLQLSEGMQATLSQERSRVDELEAKLAEREDLIAQAQQDKQQLHERLSDAMEQIKAQTELACRAEGAAGKLGAERQHCAGQVQWLNERATELEMQLAQTERDRAHEQEKALKFEEEVKRLQLSGQGSANEVARLQASCRLLEGGHTALQEELASLGEFKHRWQAATEEVMVLQSEREALELRREAQDARINELATESQVAEAEKKMLVDEQSRLQHSLELSQEELRELRQQLQQSEIAVQEQRVELEAATETASCLAKTRGDLAQMENELAGTQNIKGQLQAAQEKSSAFSDQVTSLTAQVRVLEEDRNASRSECQVATQRLDQEGQRLEAILEEMDGLKEHLQEILGEDDVRTPTAGRTPERSPRAQTVSLSVLMVYLEQLVIRLRSEHAALGTQLEAAVEERNSKAAELETASSEIKRLQGLLDTRTDELHTLERQVGSLEGSSVKLKACGEEMTDLSNALSGCRAELQQRETELSALREEAQETTQEAERAAKKYQEEVEKLEAQVEGLQEQVERGRRELEATRSKAISQVARVRAEEAHSWEVRLAEAESTAEQERGRAEAAHQKAAVQAAEVAEGLTGQVEARAAEVAMVQTEVAERAAALEVGTRQQQKLEKQIAEQDQDLQHLRKELQEMTAIKEGMMVEAEGAAQTLRELEMEAATAGEQLKLMEVSRDEQIAVSGKHEMKVMQLQQRMSAMTAQVAALRQESSTLQLQLDEARAQHAEHERFEQETSKGLQDDLAAKQRELAEVVAQAAAENRGISSRDEQIAAQATLVERLEGAHAAREAELHAAMSDQELRAEAGHASAEAQRQRLLEELLVAQEHGAQEMGRTAGLAAKLSTLEKKSKVQEAAQVASSQAAAEETRSLETAHVHQVELHKKAKQAALEAKASLEQRLGALQKDLGLAQRSAREAEQNYSNEAEQAEALERRLEKQGSENKELAQEITVHQKRLAAAESELSSSRVTAAAISEKLEGSEASMADLVAKVAHLEQARRDDAAGREKTEISAGALQEKMAAMNLEQMQLLGQRDGMQCQLLEAQEQVERLREQLMFVKREGREFQAEIGSLNSHVAHPDSMRENRISKAHAAEERVHSPQFDGIMRRPFAEMHGHPMGLIREPSVPYVMSPTASEGGQTNDDGSAVIVLDG
ncbi:hypothetical protein CYMTET_17115 [Cymbomonas tetramitiformis]|uniref:Uncharacterized protein n=1 Tax=Cymbomonas tetramitiformis TaxID=36881 RepID=A0AAE0GAX3_9CHLO|nr:hypothetical protein CYMTET_17115 [Cymbomonas tetramitiformis]